MQKDKNLKDVIIDSYIESLSEDKLFSNERIKETTRIILENQFNDFVETTKISPNRIAAQLVDKEVLESAGLTEVASSYSSQGTEAAAGDIARFGEIYMPIAAKVIPSLVINNMVGVQPMTQPNGFVYAMRAFYGTGPYDSTSDRQGAKYPGSSAAIGDTQIIKVASATGISKGSYLIDSGDAVEALVLHIEDTLIVVKHLKASVFAVSDSIEIQSAADQTYSGEDTTISAVYTNEIAQSQGLFKYYSGYSGTSAYTTDQGMYATDVGQVNIKIERSTVEAKTRQLFAEYPIEAEQDLRAIHKRDLRAELSELTAGTIVNEIAKEFIDEIDAGADSGGSTTVSYASDLDGRWESEKFRSLFTRLVKLSNDIAIDTRLGPGNFIIASSGVTTALSQLDGFSAHPLPNQATFNNISKIGADWYVGNIAGMFDVYRDIWATTEYAVVGRKGPNEWDAGVFFLPYVPLQFFAGVTQENLQPKMKFMSRYGKIGHILRTNNDVADSRYYRKLTVSDMWPVA